jgi:hypothetical protein
MHEGIKLTRKQAKPIIDACYPEYNGRKITLEFTDHIIPWDLNWGGGTRNTYTFLNARGESKRYRPAAPWCEMSEGKRVELQPDVVVVEHSIFCGHDTGLTIYAHPALAPKLLS